MRCLPIWRKSFVMNGLSCLGSFERRLDQPRHDFLKQTMRQGLKT